MNKIWYTTIFLAVAVVIVGILFFFVLPRNSLKGGEPIAMIADEEDLLDDDSQFEDYDSLEYDESEFDEWLSSTEGELEEQFDEEETFETFEEPSQPLEVVQPLSNETPAAAPVEQPMNEMIEQEELGESSGGRRQTARHKVVSGEWLAQITNKYWGDFFLWPDLYKLNTLQSGDPDLIYPGEIVKIYESLIEDGLLDYEDKKILISAYLDVYRIYKKMGRRKEQSIWRLLYSATRYEPHFLDMYKEDIDEEDRQMAIQLVAESKYID